LIRRRRCASKDCKAGSTSACRFPSSQGPSPRCTRQYNPRYELMINKLMTANRSASAQLALQIAVVYVSPKLPSFPKNSCRRRLQSQASGNFLTMNECLPMLLVLRSKSCTIYFRARIEQISEVAAGFGSLFSMALLEHNSATKSWLLSIEASSLAMPRFFQNLSIDAYLIIHANCSCSRGTSRGI